MIEEKETLTGNIESKQSIDGSINVGKIVIPPLLQEKEVTPTTSIQNVTYDENYNGLSKVVVNEIPSEYIIPSGELDITTNGTYDVTQYASAKVTTNEADLNWSLIGYNGTPNFIKDYYDYAVEIQNNWIPSTNLKRKFMANSNLIIMPLVDTSIATEVSQLFSNCSNLKCVPNLTITQATDFGYMFSGCTSITDIGFSNFDTSSVTNFAYMFSNCYSLKELDLSTFKTSENAEAPNMFNGCTALTKIDMRQFEFTKLNSYNRLFGYDDSSGPANNCLVIVKDQTQKEWVNQKIPRLTNVKTVAEYEQ